jgi:hypothetical protein
MICSSRRYVDRLSRVDQALPEPDVTLKSGRAKTAGRWLIRPESAYRCAFLTGAQVGQGPGTPCFRAAELHTKSELGAFERSPVVHLRGPGGLSRIR